MKRALARRERRQGPAARNRPNPFSAIEVEGRTPNPFSPSEVEGRTRRNRPHPLSPSEVEGRTSREPLHLIIVSYPSRLDATLEEIAHTLIRGANGRRVVERAQEPSDVRFLVRQWHLRDRELHTVDLIGHGGPGRFKLGDELLFGDGNGLSLIDEWRPFLPARATLRLLGCSVAGEEPDGHELLSQLALRLSPGSRVVAPTRALFTIDYAAGGLTPRASRCLKSSTTQRRKHHGRRKTQQAGEQPRQAQGNHAARR